MPTFTDCSEAIRIFQSHLQTQLATDYAGVFAVYGGATVILEDDHPDEFDRDVRPYLVLSIGNDVPSAESSMMADMRDAVIEAESVASGWSGAESGASNPIGSDTLLSRAFMEIVRADYGALRDMGFYRNRLESNRENINTADGEQFHRNPHRFAFSYFTPED
jgi:hypothetical protein